MQSLQVFLLLSVQIFEVPKQQYQILLQNLP